MKLLWAVLSTLAVANILGLAGFVLWLGATDRLDTGRVERIRQVFTTTIADETAKAAADAAAADVANAAAAETKFLSGSAETAETAIARGETGEAVRLQHLLRRERELGDLRRVLDRQEADVRALREALAAEREAFEAYRRAIDETVGTEQFKKALATLEGQKPADAKAVLASVIADGKTDDVVEYLNGMDDRARNRIVAEFVKDDPALAADLLERLRTRGVAPPLPGAGEAMKTTADDPNPPAPPP